MEHQECIEESVNDEYAAMNQWKSLANGKLGS